MNINRINSLGELKSLTINHKKAYLLLYKSGSGQSDCAYENLVKAVEMAGDVFVMAADVNEARDIHPEYGITTVPSLMEFDSGVFRNLVKGCQQPQVLKTLFEEAAFRASMEKEGKRMKQVTVYSTPTCSWCNTLKSYLRKNKVYFTDVDVSRNPDVARELVNRTGQQGVPQTEIDGSWVVGFDQKKIDMLLEIR